MKKLNKLVIAAAAGLGSVGAMAQTSSPDVSAITTAGTSVGVVGAAVFAVYVAVKGFKWFRSAL